MKSVLFSILVAGVTLVAQTPAVELKVGDAAPDFTLPASDGHTYKLSDFKGKQAVVLGWFPKAFTQGCTIECKSLAEHGDLIKTYDVKYFMISVDPVEQNKAFAEAQHADFPLLADPEEDHGECLRRAGRQPGRQALDLLHRQGRQDPGDRQDGQARDVRRRHGGEAR